MITGTDDGKVSIECTKIEGMNDPLVINTTHPFIMNNQDVCKQTVNFLRHSYFTPRS